jgi:hypothetical protein
MSLDATAEQTAVIDRLSTLCGGRVFDYVPEETELERDETSGLVKPYIVVTFGSLYPTEGDRTIEGEDQQPQLMPIIVECWATTASAARATAGAVRTRLVGWSPSADNASEISLRGGGWFQQRDTTGRPTRAMESVTAVTALNQSIVVP